MKLRFCETSHKNKKCNFNLVLIVKNNALADSLL